MLTYSFLIHVLKDLLGRLLEKRGIFDISLDVLEGGGVIIAVANALVGDHLDVDDLLAAHVALLIHRYDTTLRAVGNEQGKIAEIVDVVINRLDAK